MGPSVETSMGLSSSLTVSPQSWSGCWSPTSSQRLLSCWYTISIILELQFCRLKYPHMFCCLVLGNTAIVGKPSRVGSLNLACMIWQNWGRKTPRSLEHTYTCFYLAFKVCATARVLKDMPSCSTIVSIVVMRSLQDHFMPRESTRSGICRLIKKKLCPRCVEYSFCNPDRGICYQRCRKIRRISYPFALLLRLKYI